MRAFDAEEARGATEKDAIILPWESVRSQWTKEDYLRDSRWFLESSGYADSKKIHHRRGPDYNVKQTRDETTTGMYKADRISSKGPVKGETRAYQVHPCAEREGSEERDWTD